MLLLSVFHDQWREQYDSYGQIVLIPVSPQTVGVLDHVLCFDFISFSYCLHYSIIYNVIYIYSIYIYIYVCIWVCMCGCVYVF